MRKGIVKKLITALLCMTLLFTVVACGDSGNGGGGNGGGTGNSGDGGNSGGFAEAVTSAVSNAVDEVKDAMSGNSVEIYKVGNDVVAVSIKSPECQGLLPKSEYEESNDSITLHTMREDGDNVSLDMHSYSAYVWCRMDNGEDMHASAPYQTPAVTENSYFAIISYENIWNIMKLTGELRCAVYHSSTGQDVELVVADANTLIKEISYEELAEKAAVAKGITKPDCNWAGTYMANSEEVKGVMDVTVTEHGALVFDCKINDQEKTYIGYEVLPDGWEGDEPDYMYRHVKLFNGEGDGWNVRYQFTLDNRYEDDDPESIWYEYDVWGEGSNQHESGGFEKFRGWKVASDDYKDEDIIGKISKKDAGDDQYFTPDSDDYIITAEYDRTYENGTADYYELRSYNVNGLLLSSKYKYVFTSASDAQAYYDKQTSYGSTYSHYYLSGSVVYLNTDWDSYYLYENKNTRYPYRWCLGGHYFYGYKHEDGTYSEQYYLSKPITEKEYSFSMEDILFWQKIPSGTHRSLERKDATLDLSVSKEYMNIGAWGAVNDDNQSFYNFGYTRFNGKTFTSCNAELYWDYSQGDGGHAAYHLYFTEMTFDEQVATVTQYRFQVEDPYTDEITFDNFKTKTPELILKQTYDMTRAEESNYY